jgi:5-methylcytosine-specific restriction endonuclease McrA
MRLWHEKNRSRDRAYAEENKERRKQQRREWDEKNPEARRVQSHNYRARKKRNGGKITTEQMAEHRRKYGSKCAMCGCRAMNKRPMEIDHIVAVSKGGAHVLANIQFLCRACNARKSARHPIDFARDIGMLL